MVPTAAIAGGQLLFFFAAKGGWIYIFFPYPIDHEHRLARPLSTPS